MIRWERARATSSASRPASAASASGPFASLNLGRSTGDDVARVDENRRRACDALGADAAALAVNRQVHSPTVHRGGSRRRTASAATGSGPTSPACRCSRSRPTACRSRSLAHAAAAALAVLHAGWRGLAERRRRGGRRRVCGGDDGTEVAAAIGPSVGPCCYEVGPEVSGAVRRRPDARAEARSLDGRRAALRAPASRASSASTSARAATRSSSSRTAATGALRGVQGVIGAVAG